MEESQSQTLEREKKPFPFPRRNMGSEKDFLDRKILFLILTKYFPIS